MDVKTEEDRENAKGDEEETVGDEGDFISKVPSGVARPGGEGPQEGCGSLRGLVSFFSR